MKINETCFFWMEVSWSLFNGWQGNVFVKNWTINHHFLKFQLFLLKIKFSLYNTNIFKFIDGHNENGSQRIIIEFDILSQIHANNRNGP